jgi:GNAT superfamily N-acetyltransferase
MAITFRAQEAGDTGFLRRLLADTLDATLGLAHWPTAERELILNLQFEARERDWQDRYPPGRLEIIEVDGAPAGRIRLSRSAEDGSRYLVDLAVASPYRRRGLATAALSRCQEALTLHVSRANLPAQRLYAGLGFRMIGGDQTDLLLRRDLPSRP